MATVNQNGKQLPLHWHVDAARRRRLERCLRPSVSAHGVCLACGVQWERVTEDLYINPGNRSTNGPARLLAATNHRGSLSASLRTLKRSAGVLGVGVTRAWMMRS